MSKEKKVLIVGDGIIGSSVSMIDPTKEELPFAPDRGIVFSDTSLAIREEYFDGSRKDSRAKRRKKLYHNDTGLSFYYDNQRHLVCEPYSIQNLHIMAENLGIKRCWFHKDHYDIPKKRMKDMSRLAIKLRPREILKIIKDL